MEGDVIVGIETRCAMRFEWAIERLIQVGSCPGDLSELLNLAFVRGRLWWVSLAGYFRCAVLEDRK